MCQNHVSFYNKILNLYGEVRLNQVKRFAKLRIKRNKLENGLIFIKKCRLSSVVPKFIKVKPVKCIQDYERFFEKVNNKLMMGVIREYHRKITIVTGELYQLHLQLSRTLASDFWEILDAMTYSRAETVKISTEKVHDAKFKRLTKSCQQQVDVQNRNCVDKAVVNLSSHTISDEVTKALSRGLNFAPTPRKIPVESIITSIEDTIVRNKINGRDAECLRQDVSLILRKGKLPKSNIPRSELNALETLRKNPDLLVLPADKGNATVIVDTQAYERKIRGLVGDNNTYKKVTYNPTNRVTNGLNKILRTLPDDIYNSLRPLNPTPPKIYGLPKIHKPDWPLRPIVSQIDSPTYKTARFLSDMLLPFTGKTDSYVKDSRHLIHLLREVQLNENEVMVSFDVVSLFTNIPIEDTVNIISDLLEFMNIPIEYTKLIQYTLTSGYFMWKGEYYLQVDGVAMGSPIAPVAANLFMEWFEEVALANTPFKPRHWWRYVDDVFAIVRGDEVDLLLAHLNSIHPKIVITVEREREGALPFLDVLVKRDSNGRLSHTVYRKPTHTDRYLRADSHHHPAHLASVPRTLINRALKLCDPEYLDTELGHIKNVLDSNGYGWKQSWRFANASSSTRPASVERAVAYLPYIKGVTDGIGNLLRRRYSIRTIFRPLGQLRQLLRSPKDKDPLGVPGVYMIPCDCGKCYVGETRRNVSTRLAEHIRSMKNLDSVGSAVVEHSLDSNAQHYIRFDKAKVLAREKFYVPRKIREAIEIGRRPNFNRDGGWHLPPTWKPCLYGARGATRETGGDVVSSVCWGILDTVQEDDTDEELQNAAPAQHDNPPAPAPNPTPQPLSSRARRAAARSAKRDVATSTSRF